MTALDFKCRLLSLQDKMEATDGSRARALGRGRQLRGRSAHAADEPLLGSLRPSRGQSRHQHGCHIVTSERGRPSADDVVASSQPANTAHAHTRTPATRQSYTSPAFTGLLERLISHDARINSREISVNESYFVSIVSFNR